MSSFEGPALKGMNPFSNNRPRLTASERIRNKRDATIYQAEKQRFQNKKICGNKNVKYYDNGTIRSMKSYKLQKSLARGNVLCEDCDDKGLLCNGPANKDALASIQMGNNAVSEYWGGSSFQGDFTQLETFPVIQSDVSGVWDPSAATVTDPSKSTLAPGFGYIDNLIKIPRNLDGSGIVIDPSNELFPDELCDPFRYLQHSYLKTYLVLTMAVPVTSSSSSPSDRNQPSSCNDPSYNFVIENYFTLQGSPGGGVATVVNGIVKSLCCVGTLQLDVPYINPADATVTDPGIFGLFKVYVNLANIGNFDLLSMLLNTKPSINNNNLSEWPLPNITGWLVGFSRPQSSGPNLNYYINFAFIRNVDIIQGTIPPSLNQTKYNATKQSYMSCLENGTRKINFTKNTVKQDNVIAAYCTFTPSPVPAAITNLVASSVTASGTEFDGTAYQIELNWTAPIVGQGAITDYEYSIDSGANWISTGSPTNSYTYPNPTTVGDGGYTFMVRAVAGIHKGPDSNLSTINITAQFKSGFDAAWPPPGIGGSPQLTAAVAGFTGTPVQKAAVISKYGEIADWKFDNGQGTWQEGIFDFGASPGLFFQKTNFNEDLSSWDVSNIRGMNSMFDQASSFNSDISSWDVSNVIKMYRMFFKATVFNQNIGSWNVSNVMTAAPPILPLDTNAFDDIFWQSGMTNQVFSSVGTSYWITSCDAALVLNPPLDNFYVDGTAYAAGGVAGKWPQLN